MRSSTPLVIPAQRAPVEILDDNFLSDLDHAFEQIQIFQEEPKKKVAKRKAKKQESTLTDMRNTYIALTQVHLRPVLRYLKAIQMGVTSRDLCEIVYFIVNPLVSKTRKVGLVEETKALIGLQRNLKQILATKGKKITQEQREKLSKSFAPVEKGFSLEFRGHSSAVVNLLGYYKAVCRNKSIDDMERKKLFAIGIPSLTMLRTSSVEELVSLSGIHPEKVAFLRRTARSFSILSLV